MAAEAAEVADLAEGVAAAMTPAGQVGGAAGVGTLLAAPQTVWSSGRDCPEGGFAFVDTRMDMQCRLSVVHSTLRAYQTTCLGPAGDAVAAAVAETATTVGAVKGATSAVAIAGRFLDGGGDGVGQPPR